MRQILTYSKKIGVEDGSEPTNLSTEEIKAAEQKYIDLINQIVQVLIQDNPSEEDFYKALYENVFFSKLLPQNSKAGGTPGRQATEWAAFCPEKGDICKGGCLNRRSPRSPKGIPIQK